jgi:hypothetical protein
VAARDAGDQKRGLTQNWWMMKVVYWRRVHRRGFPRELSNEKAAGDLLERKWSLERKRESPCDCVTDGSVSLIS